MKTILLLGGLALGIYSVLKPGSIPVKYGLTAGIIMVVIGSQLGETTTA